MTSTRYSIGLTFFDFDLETNINSKSLRNSVNFNEITPLRAVFHSPSSQSIGLKISSMNKTAKLFILSKFGALIDFHTNYDSFISNKNQIKISALKVLIKYPLSTSKMIVHWLRNTQIQPFQNDLSLV